MPPAARPQFQRGDRRGGRVRPEARLADGLRGNLGGVQAALGKTGPLLLERDSRPGESDERSGRDVDLEKVKAETAAAHGSRRGRDLHGAGGLSRRMNSAGVEVPRRVFEKKPETPWVVASELNDAPKNRGASGLHPL